MNFWRMCWPPRMTSLHLANNDLEKSGWSKVFFSLTKLFAPPKKEEKELNSAPPSTSWPLRFLEIQSPDAVFCDTAEVKSSPNASKADPSSAELSLQVHHAHSFPNEDVISSDDPRFEQAVGIITQFISLPSVAQDLFKNDVKDLVRCFLMSEIFDRMRILNQHMFFMCLRDILWQM
jgi:hypothetical protein